MLDEHILLLPMTADYVRLALRLGAARGHGAGEVLRGTALGGTELAAPALRISQRDNFVVLDNLDRLLGPGWPFDVRFGPETSGPLGHAVASAPTVGEAMEVLAHFGQSRSPRYTLRLGTPARGRGRLEITETVAVTASQRLTGDEIIMQSLHNMLETLLGSEVAAARFAFRSPPPDHAERYRATFRGPVRFQSPVTCIEFPLAWLARPTPFANPHLFDAARTALEVEHTALRADGLLLAEVEHLLNCAAGTQPIDLATIATALGLSTRTLARRLRAAGTNFRTLRDTVLKRRASLLLGETDRSVESISAELGYADPIAFNLACHRWFGMAPRAWRQGRQKRPAPPPPLNPVSGPASSG
ncbi:MAG: AraC family transcriptional regulator ligand-binding domain-containing protein [Gammaproteobacteria bacterium]